MDYSTFSKSIFAICGKDMKWQTRKISGVDNFVAWEWDLSFIQDGVTASSPSLDEFTTTEQRVTARGLSLLMWVVEDGEWLVVEETVYAQVMDEPKH